MIEISLVYVNGNEIKQDISFSVKRCIDIEQKKDSQAKVLYNVHLGLQDISPVTCNEQNSRTLLLSAEKNNVSVPLRFANTGLFENLWELGTLVAATPSNIENICNALGYNHYSSKVITLPKEIQYRTVIEINADMKSFNRFDGDFEGCLSITCSREGNINS